MDIIIEASGNARLIYDESLDLPSLGRVTIRRGSHVEPTADGHWTADLSPVNGPTLGPFAKRNEAIAAEVDWLQRHWLLRPAG
jgi:hypothetical protein